LSPHKPLQPGLTFVGKAGVHYLGELTVGENL
jgi:hypothetical protein